MWNSLPQEKKQRKRRRVGKDEYTLEPEKTTTTTEGTLNINENLEKVDWMKYSPGDSNRTKHWHIFTKIFAYRREMLARRLSISEVTCVL